MEANKMSEMLEQCIKDGLANLDLCLTCESTKAPSYAACVDRSQVWCLLIRNLNTLAQAYVTEEDPYEFMDYVCRHLAQVRKVVE